MPSLGSNFISVPQELTALTSLSASKRILNLAIPMALSYTFSIEMWLLVTFLSRVNPDKEHDASITLITTMINALVIIGISPLFAMSMVAGKQNGELKNAQDSGEDELSQQLRKEGVARVNHHGLTIATVMTPLVALPLVFSETILKNIFGQDAAVAADAQSFMRPFGLLAVPPIGLRLCSEQMLFSFGKTKPAMVMALCNATIGMGVAYALAFGEFGAPKLKQKGVLIGYILESYLTALAFSLYIALHPDFKGYPFFRPKNIGAHFNKIRGLLNIGGPILVSNTIEMGALLANGALAGRVGVAEQAAYSTTMQFILFTFLFQSAFAQSSCQEMSRLIGDKAYKSASTIGQSGLLTSLICVTPIPLLFSIKPDYLMKILGQDTPSTKDILTLLVPLMAACVVVDTLRNGALKQLQNNLNDGKCATVIASTGLVSGVLLSWGLGLHTRLGIYGVAIGYLMGLIATTSALLVRRHSRIKPEAIEAQQTLVGERYRIFASEPTESLGKDGRDYATLASSLNVV